MVILLPSGELPEKSIVTALLELIFQVVASTVATDSTNLLSAVDTYTASELETDADDNTNWNNTTDGSTAVDGTTDQNPDDIQTDDGLSASNATYY